MTWPKTDCYSRALIWKKINYNLWSEKKSFLKLLYYCSILMKHILNITFLKSEKNYGF